MIMRKYPILLICTAMLLTGCSGKSGSSESVTETVPASAASVTTTTAEQTTASTTTAAATTMAAAATVSGQTTTAPATDTTASSTETSTEKKKDAHDDPDVLTAARKYYQACLDHDADTVYSMFEKSEIDGYCKMIEPQLSGEPAKEIFRRAAVIRAIEASMDNVREIMDYYGKSGDKWSFEVKEEDLEQIEADELNEFNKSLSTSFTKAYTCQYMIYNDETNGESFTGNSASFVEKDGKWYLSFSSSMGSDLIFFMNFDEQVETASTSGASSEAAK